MANSLGEKKDLPSEGDVFGFIENLGKGIFNTAKNTYDHHQKGSDEL